MKRALVTGGSGGIGAAICRRLGASGLHVYVHGNANKDKADGIVAEIEESGGSAESIIFDVTDAGSCQKNLEKILENDPIQILVNNAGIHDDAPLAGMTAAQWQSVIDVSLGGFYNVTQPLLLPMMSTRWGRIISMASVAALKGNRGQANYAAAKAGLLGASKSLSHEMVSRGITVNVIAPGIIESPMTNELFTKEQIKAMVPAHRVGSPDEVAALVAYLASDEAGYISGQCISIDGGMT
ncbi:MAG: 3-oxoacyl-ACP reductase FabG [Acidiferrobacterales bacterium]